jgi:hypothetical protein
MTNDAVEPITTNSTELWIKTIDVEFTGYYIDCYLVLIFGGIPWQVRGLPRVLSAWICCTQTCFMELLSSLVGEAVCRDRVNNACDVLLCKLPCTVTLTSVIN